MPCKTGFDNINCAAIAISGISKSTKDGQGPRVLDYIDCQNKS